MAWGFQPIVRFAYQHRHYRYLPLPIPRTAVVVIGLLKLAMAVVKLLRQVAVKVIAEPIRRAVRAVVELLGTLQTTED